MLLLIDPLVLPFVHEAPLVQADGLLAAPPLPWRVLGTGFSAFPWIELRYFVTAGLKRRGFSTVSPI